MSILEVYAFSPIDNISGDIYAIVPTKLYFKTEFSVLKPKSETLSLKF